MGNLILDVLGYLLLYLFVAAATRELLGWKLPSPDKLLGMILPGIKDIFPFLRASQGSRWASLFELRWKGVLRKKHDGLLIDAKNRLSLNWFTTSTHSIILGGTGEGKTKKILISAIMRQKDASMVVLDPAGEIRAATANLKERQSYRTITLNLSDISQSECQWNPIDYCEGRSSELAKLRDMFFVAAGQKGNDKDNYWNTQGNNCLRYPGKIRITRLSRTNLPF